MDDDAVRLTKVPGEPEAELLCNHLRSNGFECAYRPTGRRTRPSRASGARGMYEVLVHEKDLDRALELLPEHEA